MSVSSPKVLLVYPPNQLMAIETPRPDGSLGPLYLAAALEAAGFETDILDASVGSPKQTLAETFYRGRAQPNGLIRIGMTFEAIRDFIADGHYDVVGVSSNFTPQTRMALEVARAAKEANPAAFVIAGGVNARSLSGRFLADGLVDVICTTEGEKVVVELVRRWSRDEPWRDVDGIQFAGLLGVVTRPPRADSYHVDLDELPMPAWHKLPFDKYDQIASPHGAIAGGGLRYAPLQTSRGCPFRCAFCHISEERAPYSENTGELGALRLKSVGRVMEEIGILEALGVKKIYFEDDSLLAKKSRVETIFKALRGLGLKIADVNGVNLTHLGIASKGGKLAVDRDYLRLLKESGFDQIVFPVESASQRVLDKYATGKLDHGRLDVLELVRIAADEGITCPINMMIGFPDESEEEILASVELGRKLVAAGATYCTFFIPIPFPGSRLFDLALKQGQIHPDFDPDDMNWKNAILTNTVVPPERVIELRDWAWRSVNTKEHVERRLKESAGTRWSSAAAAT